MEITTLELNNPYAKFGLKRRPTYDELIGLINENASLFGPAPDRRATAFKASPEGSFFDGLNYTDRLKEEQERILNKEMRDILLRQKMGNQTLSVAKIGTGTPQETPRQEQFETPRATFHDSGISAQLENARSVAQQRLSETSQAMAQNLRNMGDTLMSRFMRQSAPSMAPTEKPQGGVLPLLEDDEQTIIQQPSASSSPQPLPPANLFRETIDNTPSAEYWKNNPNIREEDILFQFFLRGIELPMPMSIQEELKPKGWGRGRTYLEYLRDTVLDAIDNGSWVVRRIDQGQLQTRINEWNTRKSDILGAVRQEKEQLKEMNRGKRQGN